MFCVKAQSETYAVGRTTDRCNSTNTADPRDIERQATGGQVPGAQRCWSWRRTQARHHWRSKHARVEILLLLTVRQILTSQTENATEVSLGLTMGWGLGEKVFWMNEWMNECVYFRHKVHRQRKQDRHRESVHTDRKHAMTWNKYTSFKFKFKFYVT